MGAVDRAINARALVPCGRPAGRPSLQRVEEGVVNFKLILALSMFGLLMGVATVSVIPPSIEPAFWLVVFVICAFVIGRAQVPRPFLHGLGIGILNGVWVTAAHVVLYDAYLADHPREAQMMAGSSLPGRVMMLIVGPLIGVVSGCVLGVLALLGSRIFKPKTAPIPPAV